MTVPVVPQTAPWPKRGEAPSNYAGMADAVGATMPAAIDGINAAATFINQRATDAQNSATAAGNSATAAGQSATAAAGSASSAASSAQTAEAAAAAAGAAAGLPSISGKSGMALSVRPDESGVEWKQVSAAPFADSVSLAQIHAISLCF